MRGVNMLRVAMLRVKLLRVMMLRGVMLRVKTRHPCPDAVKELCDEK